TTQTSPAPSHSRGREQARDCSQNDRNARAKRGMKRSCLRCERTSPSNSLFCHEVDCPAEQSPAIFEPGDRMGDIEIVRTVTGLRSATVYEAVQQQRPVFMKVAHPGTDHRDRLIREAKLLRSLYSDKKKA